MVIIEEKDLGKTNPINKIIHGNALTVLRKLPSNSVDCVICSPPYWGKREYPEADTIWGGSESCNHEWTDELIVRVRGVAGVGNTGNHSKVIPGQGTHQRYGKFCKKCGAWYGQLGLEPTVEMYVDHLIQIFREVKRVLKPTGNVFVVIDDTYAGSGWSVRNNDPQNPARSGKIFSGMFIQRAPRKSLCLVPELFAIRMVYDLGFILRNKIIWAKKVHFYKEKETKGNAMPESVKDRLAHSYEFIYHFVKEEKYYYNLDAVRVNYKEDSIARIERAIDLIERTGLPVTPDNKYYQAIVSGSISKYGNAGSVTARFYLSNSNNGNKSVQLTLDGLTASNSDNNYQEKFAGMGEEAENPRARTQRNSKYLKTDVKTASPGGRLVRLVADSKENELTLVRKAIDDVNAYLKQKLKESGLTVKELAEMIGVKETTLAHYFRTDLSGAALPPREIWEKMKPILGLDDYENHIKEEYKRIIPQNCPKGANPGDVVQINLEPFSDVHFAVFPTKLVEFLIKIGCPENGIVLDPFLGSGTTALVALQTGRRFIGIEISREYCEMAKKRIEKYIGVIRLETSLE